jgi:hypothetical protein
MTNDQHAAILDALARDERADQDASEDDAPEYAAECGEKAAACEAGAAALRRGTCLWTEDSSGEYWTSECGQTWTFSNDGSPSENGMTFCFGCGKELA